MEHTSVIYVIARDNNGPEFYTGVTMQPREDRADIHSSPWVESPIMSRFSYHWAWMAEELDSAKADNYPGIENAFIERVEVVCKIAYRRKRGEMDDKSTADILYEYVTEMGLVSEWPHNDKQDAEAIIAFCNQLEAELEAAEARADALQAEVERLRAECKQYTNALEHRLDERREEVERLRAELYAYKNPVLHLPESED